MSHHYLHNFLYFHYNQIFTNVFKFAFMLENLFIEDFSSWVVKNFRLPFGLIFQPRLDYHVYYQSVQFCIVDSIRAFLLQFEQFIISNLKKILIFIEAIFVFNFLWNIIVVEYTSVPVNIVHIRISIISNRWVK